MGAQAERVGIRELRQNLSVYIRRVLRGEALEVTERGRAVAMLVPVPAQKGALSHLVAAGRVRPAQGALSEVLPPEGKASRTLSRALLDERAERL